MGWDNDDQEFDVVDFHPLATGDRPTPRSRGRWSPFRGRVRGARSASSRRRPLAQSSPSRVHAGDVVRWYSADRYSTSLTIADAAAEATYSSPAAAVFTDALSGAGVAGRREPAPLAHSARRPTHRHAPRSSLRHGSRAGHPSVGRRASNLGRIAPGGFRVARSAASLEPTALRDAGAAIS